MKKQNPSIKIFVTYKEKHKVIKSDIITPIQTGRAIADEVFAGMLGDDTGDNISVKNALYSELSAQYWVWKNYDKIGNPDYVGFMHYRRHFIFKSVDNLPETRWLPNSDWYNFTHIDEEYLDLLDDSEIRKHLVGYDCIVPKVYNYANYMYKNLIEDFEHLEGQSLDNFYLLFDVIKDLYPEYDAIAQNVKNGAKKYIANMFIMKKAMFFEYCKFLFDIEQEIERRTESAKLDVVGSRYLGYIGEIILTVFISQKYASGQYNIKEIETSFISDPDDTSNIVMPFFKGNDTVISLSSSNEYAPFLSVCLQSLIDHADSNKVYDIVILERNISEENKSRIRLAVINKPNISLRFFNVSEMFSNKVLVPMKTHYRPECYFRLYAPDIFRNFNKIIFTDCDLLFMDDILLLSDIDTNGKVVSACQDYFMNAHYGLKNGDWLEYCTKELKLSDANTYINTGVMIIDTKKFNDMNIRDKCLDIMEKKELRILEQDALNAVLNGAVTFLPDVWNVMNLQTQMKQLHFLECMQPEIQKKYLISRNNPKIIHYASSKKPWTYPDEDMADVWWMFARKTPFYETFLTQRIVNESKNFVTQHQIAYVMNHLMRYKIKKFIIKTLRHLCSNNKRPKYDDKYRKLRTLIKAARKSLKGI